MHQTTQHASRLREWQHMTAELNTADKGVLFFEDVISKYIHLLQINQVLITNHSTK